MNPYAFPPINRREFLARAGMGIGVLSLGTLAHAQSASPLAAHAPHFPPKAKRVVHFFLNGGPSNVSTCDGPPLRKKWTTRLAFGGKCGAWAASGEPDWAWA